jgi:hypothetical protein
MNDPFEVLGVSSDASQEEIHAAWRGLAKQHHPDTGGDAGQMILVNEAFRVASLSVPQVERLRTKNNQGETSSTPKWSAGERVQRTRRDVSSFTFNVLPVDCFPLLEIVASKVGAIIEEDCPYLIEFSLENLSNLCDLTDWCRCELVPEAGGTMVHLTIGGLASSVVPGVEYIRDQLIHCVNEISEITLVE